MTPLPLGASLDALPSTPPVLAMRDALFALPAADRPAFVAVGSLERAPNHALARGPGLYLILFDTATGARAYHGMADTLSLRLQVHRRCAQRLGFPVAGHQVLVAPMKRSIPDLRRIEKALNTRLLARHRVLVTNQRTELELASESTLTWNEEHHMHALTCQCPQCRAGGAFETFEFGFEAEQEAGFGARDGESPFSEAEETELALELLAVASEDELDQFLGKLFKGAWKGLKKVGSALGKIAKPLGGVLKGLAKKALPFVGGALGSLIPIPGVGTALGSALGSAVSKALEAEFSALEAEEQQFEMARRFVRIAGTAAQQAARAAASADPQAAVCEAVLAAARRHLPRLGQTSQRQASGGGRWLRRGGQIVIVGA